MSYPLSRIIGIVTENDDKFKEMKRHFAKYGIKCIKLPKDTDFDKFLDTQDKNIRRIVMCCLCEQTTIVCKDTDQEIVWTDPNNIGKLVTHVSTITVKFQDRTTKTYSSEIDGYMCLPNLSLEEIEGAFGFDYIFRMLNNGKTYSECLKTEGYVKESPRDRNICALIQDIIHYKKPVLWYHTKVGQEKCIDFSIPFHQILEMFREQIFHINMENTGFSNMYRYICNQGAQMRAPWTRVTKTAWVVGLNTGIPFTPKKDCPMHEFIFWSHDCAHNMRSDPMPDGMHSPLAQKVYFILRLVSEVFTLSTADMVIVDILMKAGCKYPTVKKRKIYPIFEELLQANPDFFKTLRAENYIDSKYYQLLRATYMLIFQGDRQPFSDLGISEKTLDDMDSKYAAYFRADALWSKTNGDAMMKSIEDANKYKLWWDRVSKWREFGHDIEMESIGEIIANCQIDDHVEDEELMNTLFEYFYKTAFDKMFRKKIEFERHNVQQKNRLIRYMMGQAFAFFLRPDPTLNHYLDNIERILQMEYTDDRAEVIIALFQQYLSVLHNNMRITTDEFYNWSNIVPLFPVNYIDYDHDNDTTDTRTYIWEIMDSIQ